MLELVRRLTVEQASLAFILTCLATIALLNEAEVELATKLHVAHATYAQNAPPNKCTSDSLKPLSNDLRSFDPRKSGYSRKQAIALLCAMHANEKRAATAYLDNRFYWDMAFPIIYGPCLAIVLLFLIGQLGLSNWLVYVAILVPLAGAGFDIAENLVIRDLIETGPDASVASTDLASYLTQFKYALVVPVFVIGTLGMLVALTQRSFKPR